MKATGLPKTNPFVAVTGLSIAGLSVAAGLAVATGFGVAVVTGFGVGAFGS